MGKHNGGAGRAAAGGGEGALTAEDTSRINAMYAFQSGPARYAKGKVAVAARAAPGELFATPAARIAAEVGGRYSGRERAYIMSPTQYRRMQERIVADKADTENMWRRRNRG